MLDKSKIEVENKAVGSTLEAGLARRRLIRAGLAAAPIVLGLKSQSALATGSTSTGHCKPSVWSSLKAANGCHSSHAPNYVGNSCGDYDYWKSASNAQCDKYFHQHVSGNCVPFSGSDYSQSGHPVPTLKEVCAGKYKNSVTVSTGNSAKDKLGKYCAAMYLDITVNNNCPLDLTAVNQIWNGCKDGGSWMPPHGGTAWTRNDCNEYFDYICKGTKPVSWGSSCA